MPKFPKRCLYFRHPGYRYVNISRLHHGCYVWQLWLLSAHLKSIADPQCLWWVPLLITGLTLGWVPLLITELTLCWDETVGLKVGRRCPTVGGVGLGLHSALIVKTMSHTHKIINNFYTHTHTHKEKTSVNTRKICINTRLQYFKFSSIKLENKNISILYT
jgi:hypothetical protein